MSEPVEGPGAPFPGSTGAAPHGGYRPVIGAHRADGLGRPGRGYLFTVALLAGTASMPILAAISAGSATVGRTALPDTSTPFIPTPSVGPVVIQATGQPALIPGRPVPTMPAPAGVHAPGADGPAIPGAAVPPTAPASARWPRSPAPSPSPVGAGRAAAPSYAAAPASLPSPSPSPSPTCSPTAILQPIPVPTVIVPLPAPRPTGGRTPSPGGRPDPPSPRPAATVTPQPGGAEDPLGSPALIEP